MAAVIDLDRYPEFEPDERSGPATVRRRPRSRALAVLLLTMLAAAPAAPPGAATVARRLPEPPYCLRSDAQVRLRVVLGDQTDTYHILGAVPAPIADLCHRR